MRATEAQREDVIDELCWSVAVLAVRVAREVGVTNTTPLAAVVGGCSGAAQGTSLAFACGVEAGVELGVGVAVTCAGQCAAAWVVAGTQGRVRQRALPVRVYATNTIVRVVNAE
jgi:hypothetical protein